MAGPHHTIMQERTTTENIRDAQDKSHPGHLLREDIQLFAGSKRPASGCQNLYAKPSVKYSLNWKKPSDSSQYFMSRLSSKRHSV